MSDRQLTIEIKNQIRADYSALKEIMPNFKPRAAQGEMMAASAKALATDRGVCLIEAPTGIGKSMAYLLSVIPVAKAHDKKVVIATGTIALQQQLIKNDIPTYKKVVGELNVAIALGRSRYVCPRNVMDLAGVTPQATIPGIESEGVWSRPPKAGEVEIVHTLATELSDGVWDGVIDNSSVEIPSALRPLLTTTSAGCSGQRCAFAASCPFIKARLEVEKADIIIANHALVFADLMMENDHGTHGGVILPAPEDALYIFDEGHHLAESAIDASAKSVILTNVSDQIKKHVRPLTNAYRVLKKEQVAGASLEQCLGDLTRYQELMRYMETAIQQMWQPEASLYDPSWTAPLGKLPKELRDMAVQLSALACSLERISSGLRTLVSDAGLANSLADKMLRDLGYVQEFYDAHYLCWHIWQKQEDDQSTPFARWVSKKGRALSCHASAISANEFLSVALWPHAAGVLITSATLGVGGDFTSVTKRLGVPSNAVLLNLESPFDIHENGQLLIPWMPVIPSDQERHTASVVQWLIRDNHWQQGNLVIFTSKRKMNQVFEALPESLKASVKVQTDSVSKADLVASHCKDIDAGKGSTLFGLESLGTGLNLVGDYCTSVVITQLPFMVPSDPVGLTRSAYCEKRGGRPFHDITIPDTIQTLTQYAGRLLRTHDDKGRVVILDRRIVNNPYGRRIIKALPPFSVKTQAPGVAHPEFT